MNGAVVLIDVDDDILLSTGSCENQDRFLLIIINAIPIFCALCIACWRLDLSGWNNNAARGGHVKSSGGTNFFSNSI